VESLLKLKDYQLSAALMKIDLNNYGEHLRRISKYSVRLSLPKKKVRVGWELCAQAIARDGNEDSLLEEFPNINDKDLEW